MYLPAHLLHIVLLVPEYTPAQWFYFSATLLELIAMAFPGCRSPFYLFTLAYWLDVDEGKSWFNPAKAVDRLKLPRQNVLVWCGKKQEGAGNSMGRFVNITCTDCNQAAFILLWCLHYFAVQQIKQNLNKTILPE